MNKTKTKTNQIVKSADIWLKGKYRNEIDGLRTLAVMSATIHNFWESFLPCGYLGVDMFAVVSGYVITASLYGRKYINFKNFITSFYERRAKRLIPGLLFMVVIIGFLSLLIIPYHMISDPINTGVSSLLGISNFHLIKINTDYFAIDSKLNPFTATWSLSSEEQYYLIFPIILWLTGFTYQAKKARAKLIITIIALSIISCILFIFYWFKDQTIAYFLMPTRFWEMGTGCLICILYEKKLRNSNIYLNKFFSVFILALLLVVFFLPLRYNLASTFLVVALTSILIAFTTEKTVAFKFLSNPLTSFISRISYSLYLWRWPVIALLIWKFGSTNGFISILGIIIIFTIATISTIFIEEPFRFNFKKKYISLIILPSIAISSAFSLFFTKEYVKSNNIMFGNNRNSNFNQYKLINENYPCSMSSGNKNLDIKSCLTRRSGKPTIFLVGSSHSTNYVPSIEKIYKDLGYGQFLYFDGWKSIPDNPKLIIKHLSSQIKFGDLILYTRDQDSFGLNRVITSSPSRHPKNIFKNELNELKKIIMNKGSKLILINDLPSFKFGEWSETINYENRRKGISIEEALIRRKRFSDILYSYVDEKNIFVLDPINEVCKNNWCDIKLNGNYLYGDYSPHLTVNHSYIFSDYFLKYLPRAY